MRWDLTSPLDRGEQGRPPPSGWGGRGPLFLLSLAGGLTAAGTVLLWPWSLLLWGLGLLAWGTWRTPLVPFLAALAVALLLPFGVAPVDVGVRPAFLELLLLLAWGRLAVDWVRGRPLGLGPAGPWLLLFWGWSLFRLLAHVPRLPAPLILHNYVKTVLLGLSAYLLALNLAREEDRARWILRTLILAGTASALVGLVLYLLPRPTAERLLVSLGPVGYPTWGRVLRYINDDPHGTLRAIGTAVDPNSYGGMLALAGALTAAQAFVRRPVLPRPVVWGSFGLIVGTLYLTYSRAAAGGLAVALAFLALRYRLLWLSYPAGAALLVGTGPGRRYLRRLLVGIRFQDLANQMRLLELRRARELLSRHPWWGIGYGAAPRPDLIPGVSNIYLTLWEQVGLVGLLLWLGAVASVILPGLGALWRPRRPLPEGARDRLWGTVAAVLAALAIGLLDHYFVHLDYAHESTLLWTVLGLGAAALTAEVEERG